MLKRVNECYTRLHGDVYRNPRFSSFERRVSDGANIVTGVMRADSRESVKADPPLRDVPFRLTIPAGLSDWDFHQVNAEIWRRLRDNESLMDLDFTPLPPANPGNSGVSGGAIALAIFLGVAVLSAAFGSRSSS